jgi:hypothetical protein
MKKLIALFIFIGTFTFASAQSNYYNDYQSSITNVNWQTLATELLLNSQQTNQLVNLNNRYPDYNSWNNHYRNNPNAWKTERYSEIQRILGPVKYRKFKNKYYRGQNPVAVYNRNKHYYKNKDHGDDHGRDNEENHGREGYNEHGNGEGHGHDHGHGNDHGHDKD